jgi:hypothetical protein
VEGEDRLNEVAHVDDVHVVIGLNGEGLDHLLYFQIGQQVEDVLEVVNNGLVIAQLAVDHIF